MDNRNLAKKGRYGDTHIRDVYGIKSHVNKLEADIIDSYGLLGELFVETTGSGTINPSTGLPEYHQPPRTTQRASTPSGVKAVYKSAHDDSEHTHLQTVSQGQEVDTNFDWTVPYEAKLGGEGGDAIDPTSTDYGLESISKKDFFQADGKTPKPIGEIVNLIMKHKPYKPVSQGGTHTMSAQEYRDDIAAKVEDFMPKLQEVSEEEKGFLGTAKDIAGQERDLAMTRATDTYGLTTRAAERGLQSSLGQAQQQASSLGGQMRGAYGGSSMGMRGAIGGQQTLAKGVESTYGAYGDTMLGAQQQLGYAETAGGIGEQRADLTYERGMYGLEQGVEGEFETNLGTLWDSFKQGGKVPTFSEVLSKLPDAGGS